MFGKQGNPKKIRRSDAGDLRHAICSSVADVFVTGDKDLRDDLKRVDIPNYEVIDLKELLAKF